VQIAFLVSKVNVNDSFFDIYNFILPEVLVCWKFVSGSHVLGSHNEVLRTVVSWADLQHEVSRRRFSSNASLTLSFSSRSGLATAWDVVTELDCADRV
jgi:hypothetical protein